MPVFSFFSWLTTIIVLACFTATGSAQEIQRQLIKDGEVEIETFVFGSGSETIIIAAGNGRPAADLDDLAKRLATEQYRVVTYNYRSIGDSKGPLSNITLHDFAGDIWRIADALGAGKVHLAGKTYGNRVVRAASADHPERAKTVILIGSGGEILPTPEVQAKYKRYINPDIPKDEWLKLQGELNFAPGNRHLARESAARGSYPALAKVQIAANNATPSKEWVGGGTAPMLVLVCLKDIVAVPENGLNLAKKRPNTWLIGIPGCGHNMIFEQLDVLAKKIDLFISSDSKLKR